MKNKKLKKEFDKHKKQFQLITKSLVKEIGVKGVVKELPNIPKKGMISLYEWGVLDKEIFWNWYKMKINNKLNIDKILRNKK